MRLQIVKKRLADGTIREYVYQRRSTAIYVTQENIGRKPWTKRSQHEERVYAVRALAAMKPALAAAKNRAKKRGISFSLTEHDLQQIFEMQLGKCAITGLKFDVELTQDREAHTKPFRPSIDQRIAGAGYTRENCRIVCFAVNAALGNWGEEVFLKIAEAAVNRSKTPKPPLISG